ncbi:MAG TPA: C4-type zinc ribbon domain-containing protein [Anaerolineales bacterium]
MSASLGLFRLQQIDSQITQIETRLAKIQKTLEDNAELQAALEQVKAAEEEQHASERAQHKSEDEAKSQQIKIQQAESSLYGGAVRNPKELQDLQADIASLKKHLASLEESELQDMLRTEDAQSAVKKAQDEVSRMETRLGGEHRQLFDEKESLTRELNRLQSERQAVVSPIAMDLLKTYDELRQQRRGVAVAEVSDNACGACGTTLTAAIQQTARYAAELIRCPSCGRILFAV